MSLHCGVVMMFFKKSDKCAAIRGVIFHVKPRDTVYVSAKRPDLRAVVPLLLRMDEKVKLHTFSVDAPVQLHHPALRAAEVCRA